MAENETIGAPSILIVEDNFINQKVAASMLEDFGLPVLMADDGQQAIECLKDHADVCLILMDLQMPVMDGVSSARAIRAGEAGAHYQSVPIVALTANTDDSNRKACEEVGMDGFLCKPIHLPTFKETVTRFIPKLQDHG